MMSKLNLPEKISIPIIMDEFSKAGVNSIESGLQRLKQYVNNGEIVLFFEYTGMSFNRNIYLIEALAQLALHDFDDEKEVRFFIDSFNDYSNQIDEELDIREVDFKLGDFIHKNLPIKYGWPENVTSNHISTVKSCQYGRISLIQTFMVQRLGAKIEVEKIKRIDKDNITFYLKLSNSLFTPYFGRLNNPDRLFKPVLEMILPLSEVFTLKDSLERFLGINEPEAAAVNTSPEVDFYALYPKAKLATGSNKSDVIPVLKCFVKEKKRKPDTVGEFWNYLIKNLKDIGQYKLDERKKEIGEFGQDNGKPFTKKALQSSLYRWENKK